MAFKRFDSVIEINPVNLRNFFDNLCFHYIVINKAQNTVDSFYFIHWQVSRNSISPYGQTPFSSQVKGTYTYDTKYFLIYSGSHTTRFNRGLNANCSWNVLFYMYMELSMNMCYISFYLYKIHLKIHTCIHKAKALHSSYTNDQEQKSNHKLFTSSNTMS